MDFKCNYCDQIFQTDKGRKIHQTKKHGKSASSQPAQHEINQDDMFMQSNSKESELRPAFSNDNISIDQSESAPNAESTPVPLSETGKYGDLEHAGTANCSSDKIESSLKCDYCSRVFPTNRGRKIHQTKMHSKAISNSLEADDNHSDASSVFGNESLPLQPSCNAESRTPHMRINMTTKSLPVVSSSPNNDNSEQEFLKSASKGIIEFVSHSSSTIKDGSLSPGPASNDNTKKALPDSGGSPSDNKGSPRNNLTEQTSPESYSPSHDHTDKGSLKSEFADGKTSTESFKCDYCVRTFPTNKGRKIHQTKMHSKETNKSLEADDSLSGSALVPGNEKTHLPPSGTMSTFLLNDQRKVSTNTLSSSISRIKKEPTMFSSPRIDKIETKSRESDLASNYVTANEGNEEKDVCCSHDSGYHDQEDDLSSMDQSRSSSVVQNCKRDEPRRLNQSRSSSAVQKSELSDDSSDEDGELFYDCQSCTESFYTEEALNMHRTKMHQCCSKRCKDDIDVWLNHAKTFNLCDPTRQTSVVCEDSSLDALDALDNPNKTKDDTMMSKRTIEFENVSPSKPMVKENASDRIARQIRKTKLSFNDVRQTVKVVNTMLYNFMNELKRISPEFGWSRFQSGSYYDKTKNSQPDEFDIMIYPRNLQVKVDFDSGTTVSGFYKVKLLSQRAKCIQTIVDKDGYLSPSGFKNYVFGLFDEVKNNIREGRRMRKELKPDDHSPAYTFKYLAIPGREIDIDLVPSFRINDWPPIAKTINPTWLTQDQVVDTACRCYDVVCKTCPEDVPDKDLLWRLSFSFAEKKLINHANDGNRYSNKKKSFKIVKRYVEEVKEKHRKADCKLVKKFCSYHIKHFMLHQFDQWKTNTDLETQRFLLRALIEILSKGHPHIDNYFVENDNILRFVPQNEIELVVQGLRQELKHLQ